MEIFFFFSKLTVDVKTMGIYEGFSYQLSKTNYGRPEKAIQCHTINARDFLQGFHLKVDKEK